MLNYSNLALLPSIDVEREINNELIEIAYRQMPSALYSMILVSSLLAMAQWSVINHKIILIWLALILLITGWRFYLYKIFIDSFSSETADELRHSFFKALIVSSIIFGSASFFLFPSDDIIHQLFLAFVIGGMCAGAITTLSSIRYAVSIFLALTLLPLIISVGLVRHSFLQDAMLLMIGLFWIMLLIISRRLYDNTYKTLYSNMQYKIAAQELRCTEERFETIFEQAPVGIFYYNKECVILEVNNTMTQVLKANKETLCGLNMNYLEDIRFLPATKIVFEGKEGSYVGPYCSTLSGQHLHIMLHSSPVYDDKRNIIGGVGIAMDITERVDSENTIQHLANHDLLTDIPNRFLLLERIQEALNRHKSNQKQSAALMFISLDRFKTINDALGHHIGDEILKDVVQRIQRHIGEEDTIARVGGDEFVVLILNSGKNIEEATFNIESIATKIHDAVTIPFNIDGHVFNITSSIGIAFIHNDDESAYEILKHADTAMCHAKKEGKNTTRFYQQQMDEWMQKRLFLERELHNAIHNKELELFYQPVIEIKTGKIIGAEALLRWNHPSIGLIMPDDIISIAEESGQIIPIGEWVLLHACQQCMEWKNNPIYGDKITKIAVNVSALQFKQDNFMDTVKRVIEDTKIDPNILEIELTESMIIDNLEATIAKMNELRQLGIRISIDDFGTGYSSLSYLKKLPFTTLKIDQSFIRDIMVDHDNAAMVQTMISMASIFKFNVIAEGVETLDQFKFLEELGCQYYQGYLCSKPVQAYIFEEMLIQTYSLNG